MTAELNLPPLYQGVVLDKPGADADSRSHARAMAAAGAAAGTFVWAAREDRLDCAVVLAPEEPAVAILPIVLVGALALSDAVGAVGPPAVGSDLVWPADLRVNGGRVGGLSLDLADPAGGSEAPAWAVLSAAIRMAPEPGVEGGERPDATCLHDEGFAGVGARALAESFARQFLTWMDRWEDQGLPPIARHWLHRARSDGADTVLMIGEELVAGSIEDIDGSGGLVLDTAGGRRVLPLEPQLLARNPLDF